MEKYWKGGNWSVAANWSNTQGGAGGDGTPTLSDSMHWHNVPASSTYTMDVGGACLNMDWTGATNNPTLSLLTNNLSFYGNATFIAAMTIINGSNGVINARGAASVLTSNGVHFASELRGSSAGSLLTLADPLWIAGVFEPYGSFDSGGYSMTIGYSLNDFGVGGVGRTINFRNSVITVAIETHLDGTGITLNLGSCRITTPTFSLNSAAAVLANTAIINLTGTLAAGNVNYNGTTFNLNGAAQTITGAFTAAVLGLMRAGVQAITATGASITITSLVRDAGISIKTIIGGTFIKADAGSEALDYFSISGSAATGLWYVSPHYTDGGGNTGWIFGNCILSPATIASAEAIGTAQFNFELLTQAIASSEYFGTAIMGLYLLPVSIASAEAFSYFRIINKWNIIATLPNRAINVTLE